jgi:hypothetical protein
MIVCSLPRCGATRFCLDLQESSGLPFVGELNPMYVDSCNDANVKQPYHETKFQPTYTQDTYLNAIVNPSDYVVLVNQSPHLYIDRADYVMLRKDMRDAFLSLANFFLLSRPYLRGDGVIQHLYLSFHSLYGVLLYLNKYQKPIVWYEDYYGIEGTKTETLDKHPHKKIIISQIDKLFAMNDTSLLLEQVRIKDEQTR